MDKTDKYITIIRHSCLTGNAVWIYRGRSVGGAQTAYWRACQAEIERVRQWADTVAARMSNIARLLNDCLADVPLNAALTPQQQTAVRALNAIGKKGISCHREFYEHIMEERLRRRQDKKIRREMRERENRVNGCYDK